VKAYRCLLRRNGRCQFWYGKRTFPDWHALAAGCAQRCRSLQRRRRKLGILPKSEVASEGRRVRMI
jgi:hypothetical protein